MVFICPKEYTGNKYIDKYSKFPYELDHFQKWAIEGIEENKNVLITAHTGSGKSMPFEYSIHKFCCEDGKKVIYTSPIKSLSNQKYYELKDKYPGVSIGILTGDIKFNPEADVLIMTTEILRNTLFQKEEIRRLENSDIDSKEDELNKLKASLSFDIDINNELGCVVFDEVHYINDKERGKVWEESIMCIPKDIQIIMLSATIDRAEDFGLWVEKIKGRETYIASTDIRVVPLTHYSYVNYPKSLIKEINTKDKEIVRLMNMTNNNIEVIKENNGKFNLDTLENQIKINKYLYKNRIRQPNNKYVLNQIAEKLKEEDKLPGICFTFSRVKVEKYAECIEKSLFNEEDEEEKKKPSLVEKECKNILMKLPNYREYMELPEYTSMIELLKKGVAIHHSGVIPVLREMVELLFSKGYIKMLFATETFAVGINMPTKTALFTSLKKYDGIENRYLYSHEYTQMAGRAGRRGLDKLGTVIHLNNMFDMPTLYEYKNILSGIPQRLESKLSIDSSLILKILGSIENDKIEIEELTERFIEKSMKNNELYDMVKLELEKVNELEKEYEMKSEGMKYLKMKYEELEEYHNNMLNIELLNGKKKKRKELELKKIKESNKSFSKDYEYYKNLLSLKNKVEKIKNDTQLINMNNKDNIIKVIKLLEKCGYIEEGKLTIKGKIASMLNETNGLVFSELIHNNYLKNIDIDELIMFLSTYSGLKVKEEYRVENYKNINNLSDNLYTLLDKQANINMKYINDELLEFGSYNKNEYEINYDLIDILYNWTISENEKDCREVLGKIYDIEVFTGEFVKALLKINNIVIELEKVATYIEDIELLYKLSKVKEKTLKYVASNQSLYL
jgi:superfamily II RNA helicase